MEKTKNNILTYEDFNAECNAIENEVTKLNSASEKLYGTSQFLYKYVRVYVDHINKHYDGQMWSTLHLIHRTALFGMALSRKARAELFDKEMELFNTYLLG